MWWSWDGKKQRIFLIPVAAAFGAARGIVPLGYGADFTLRRGRQGQNSLQTRSKRHESLGRLCGNRRIVPFRRKFNLCDASCLEDESARISFAGDGVVSLPIQENDPACEGAVCNIRAVCDIMTDVERGSEASFSSIGFVSFWWG